MGTGKGSRNFMGAWSYIRLFFVGLENLLYNAMLFFYELFLFGTRPWWWRLRLACSRRYLFTSLFRIVKTESRDAAYPEENFTYGETPCVTVQAMLREAGHRPGGLFVDLGCGRGMAAFYAHYLGGMKAHGYDLIPTFIRNARAIANELDAGDVSFFQKDIMESDISKAQIVYVAGTTFSDAFVKRLNVKLRQAPPDACVITLSYSLPERYFNLYREQVLLFSWGRTHVYYHRRRKRPKLHPQDPGSPHKDV
jgi:SAM-dependent methyltransferase